MMLLNLFKLPDNFWEDYKWWYKQQAPKYGYYRSIWDCLFNAMYFKRDGTYRRHTNGKLNE